MVCSSNAQPARTHLEASVALAFRRTAASVRPTAVAASRFAASSSSIPTSLGQEQLGQPQRGGQEVGPLGQHLPEEGLGFVVTTLLMADDRQVLASLVPTKTRIHTGKVSPEGDCSDWRLR